MQDQIGSPLWVKVKKSGFYFKCDGKPSKT